MMHMSGLGSGHVLAKPCQFRRGRQFPNQRHVIRRLQTENFMAWALAELATGS